MKSNEHLHPVGVPRRSPSALARGFEVTSSHALAPLTSHARAPHVALNLGNAKHTSPARWIL